MPTTDLPTNAHGNISHLTTPQGQGASRMTPLVDRFVSRLLQEERESGEVTA